MLPGGGIRAVAGKVVVDQMVAAPLTISAFYIGEFHKAYFKCFFVLVYFLELCVYFKMLSIIL